MSKFFKHTPSQSYPIKKSESIYKGQRLNVAAKYMDYYGQYYAHNNPLIIPKAGNVITRCWQMPIRTTSSFPANMSYVDWWMGMENIKC